jgi:hypothetical protein
VSGQRENKDGTLTPETPVGGGLDDRDELIAEVQRLRAILDRPDPHDFITASEVEARYQMVLWGDGDGFPTAFNGTDDSAFVYLLAYLAGKVAATPDDDLDKKLHRITTIAAAAANWHLTVSRRVTASTPNRYPSQRSNDAPSTGPSPPLIRKET